MRAVAQRVSEASVHVGGEVVGSIGAGLLVYLGAGKNDNEGDAVSMAKKLAGLRIFPDEAGKMSRSVSDMAGGVLIVSQFTLFGDARKGRRPSFESAAPPERAKQLYELVISHVSQTGLVVASGRFQAHMDVRCRVDGPVTILLDTQKQF